MSDEDFLQFEVNNEQKKRKTTFASMINQKELSSADLDDLFLMDLE